MSDDRIYWWKDRGKTHSIWVTNTTVGEHGDLRVTHFLVDGVVANCPMFVRRVKHVCAFEPFWRHWRSLKLDLLYLLRHVGAHQKVCSGKEMFHFVGTLFSFRQSGSVASRRVLICDFYCFIQCLHMVCKTPVLTRQDT